MTSDAPNETLRGQKITAVFEVMEVKKLELPELSHSLLDDLGGFKSEADLRDAIKDDLQRQLEYHQQQEARRQITALLTESANWQLPPELLKRQSRRELERAVLELRRNGFGENEIRAYENELRQNSAALTARRSRNTSFWSGLPRTRSSKPSPMITRPRSSCWRPKATKARDAFGRVWKSGG